MDAVLSRPYAPATAQCMGCSSNFNLGCINGETGGSILDSINIEKLGNQRRTSIYIVSKKGLDSIFRYFGSPQELSTILNFLNLSVAENRTNRLSSRNDPQIYQDYPQRERYTLEPNARLRSTFVPAVNARDTPAENGTSGSHFSTP